MKRCFKCGEEKPLTEFYKHPRMADGHLNKCGQCTRTDVTTHRRRFLDRHRSYDRKRATLAHRVQARKEYAKSPAGRRSHAASIKRMRAKWPEKDAARILVRDAIKKGSIVRGPCEKCGATNGVHGHHDDYSRPLDVRWLCATHHAVEHGRQP